MLKPIGALAIIAVVAIGPKAATEEIANWHKFPDRPLSFDTADTEYRGSIQIIESDPETGPTIALLCVVTTRNNHILYAEFQSDPKAEFASGSPQDRPLKKVTARLRIGEHEFTAPFMQYPISKRIISSDSTNNLSIFNAISRGDSIPITHDGKETAYTVPNNDPVFRAFSKDCPTTNPDKLNAGAE